MLNTRQDAKHIAAAVATNNTPTARFNRAQNLQTLEQDSAELQLLKLLQQHQHVNGWIVLVAPSIKPNKAFWQKCQLPLQKILFIHPKQIRNVNSTLRHAICSKSCDVVINCLTLSEQEQRDLQILAQDENTHFYAQLNAASVQH